MAVISDVLRGPYGDVQPNVIITMQAKGTTARVLTSNSSSTITDAAGKYSMTVFPGEYEVTVSTLGHVGDIRVLTDSVNGTLNDFLIAPAKPEELTPEVVRTVDTMRAEAANSAAAAKVSETNATAVTGVLNSSPGGVSADILWRRIGKISNFGQGGKTLVITIGGTAQYNGRTSTNGLTQIVIRSGSGGVTTVNASGRASISAYVTNGAGTAASLQLINDLGLIEVSANTYEVYLRYNPFIGDISASVAGVSMSDLISNWKWEKTIVDNPTIVLDREIIKVWTEGSLPNPLKVGDYGLGNPYTPTVTDLSAQLTNQWWHTSGIATAPNTGLWAGISGGYDAVSRWNMAFLQGGTTVDFRVQVVKSGTAGAWATVWHTLNTTVDANGFIKKASPIVKLFGTGESELNDQSQGVTTKRLSEGVYRISGVFGFNGDGAWGGAGNGIEIPVDDNKRPLIWVESKVLPDGDIEIRTYHRTYATGPYSARNIEAMDSGEVGKKKQPIFVEMPDGTPIDIPAGRWIDLRVEMPASDDPEPDPILEEGDTPYSEQPAVNEPTPETTEPKAEQDQELEQSAVIGTENGEDADTGQNDEPKE